MELNTQQLMAQRIRKSFASNDIIKSDAVELDPLDDQLIKGSEQSVDNLLAFWRKNQVDSISDLLTKAFSSNRNTIEKSGHAGLVAKKVQIKKPDGEMYYAIRWLKPNQVTEGQHCSWSFLFKIST